MSTTDFIDRVQSAAPFDSRDQAEQTVRATLQQLGECLSPGEVEDLATALPPDLAQEIRTDTPTQLGPKPLDDFLAAIQDATGIPRSELEPRVRAVTAALRETVGEEEFENAGAQLPPEYDRIMAESAPLAETFAEAVTTHPTFDAADEARVAARTTVRTLGERISRGEAENVATYLQGDAEEWILDEDLEQAAAFGVEEFVDRIADRAGVSDDQAQVYARAVTDVLEDVVPTRELRQATAQLPPEYDAVLSLPEE